MLIRKGETGKWYPNSIPQLQGHLEQLMQPIVDLPAPRCSALVKNVSYSLQHLEFLYRVHEDLKLSEVIWKQTIKTFLIVGASVIEAVFFYLLIANDKASKTVWASSAKVETPEFEEHEKKKKIVSELFLKLERPVLEEMTFDTMCKKLEKRGLSGLSSEEFHKHLPHLRKLRNRVHIHTSVHGADTDCFAFGKKDFDLVRKVLQLLLTSDLFPSKNEEYWEFLKAELVEP